MRYERDPECNTVTAVARSILLARNNHAASHFLSACGCTDSQDISPRETTLPVELDGVVPACTLRTFLCLLPPLFVVPIAHVNLEAKLRSLIRAPRVHSP